MKLRGSMEIDLRSGIAGKLMVAVLMIALLSCSGNDAPPTSSPTTSTPQVTVSEPLVTFTPQSTTTPVAATSVQTPISTENAAKKIPRFEPGDCAASVNIGLPHRCGWLVVPEDRTKQEARHIRLPVVIFNARTPDPQPDPVIYLTGGGGADQMAMMSLYSDFVEEVVSERDFIMYNQRGAPLTDPALECTGIGELFWELAEQHPPIEERNMQLTEFWSQCRSDLAARGIDLNMYSTSANAADADDLRIALGYDQANYYGTSYGTRIGLFLLRDRSEGVRSIILDSAYPPEADYYTSYALNVAAGLSALFDECNSDPACVSRYGDLGTQFSETVERLEAEPQIITYPEGDVVVDGDMYIDVIYALLQSAPGREGARSFIKSASKGDLEPFRPVYPALFDYPGSMAVYYSFQCREEVPKHSFDEVVAEAAGVPEQVRDYAVNFFAALDYAVCTVWEVQPSDASEIEPVQSDVPALVLAGTFDPITPARWGRSAAEFLSSGWFFEFPGQSHGTMRTSACAREIALAFLKDPSRMPDSTCIEETN
ncbi:MAG: alpha/beta fold hydrolase [Chloroflexota bacterium]|nr:MAG: alpha/beta fold hydrolase [Chloroflexota bacterium]